jgi:hypothetical protein
MARRMPYSVAHRRELSNEERALLRLLAPERELEIQGLKVVARCGCGKCPTVLFAPSFDAQPVTGSPHQEIATYRGENADGVDVAITLVERNGRLSELEAWAPVDGDIRSWPPIGALKPFKWR